MEYNDDEFVDIIGYEGDYMINRRGEIFSLKSNKILKYNINNSSGYLRLCLIKDKMIKYYLLHRLLAIQFIPNPENFPEVDHIDQDKLNNNLINLRWVTCKTNSRNRRSTINHEGCIRITGTTKKGQYYRATFYYDYGKTIYKSSYNRNELVIWIEEMKIKYARDEIYNP